GLVRALGGAAKGPPPETGRPSSFSGMKPGGRSGISNAAVGVATVIFGRGGGSAVIVGDESSSTSSSSSLSAVVPECFFGRWGGALRWVTPLFSLDFRSGGKSPRVLAICRGRARWRSAPGGKVSPSRRRRGERRALRPLVHPWTSV